MTKKRFTMRYRKYIDNVENIEYDEKWESWKICELLNELYEEKEIWKRECERLKGLYYLENEKDEHLAWKRIDVK